MTLCPHCDHDIAPQTYARHVAVAHTAHCPCCDAVLPPQTRKYTARHITLPNHLLQVHGVRIKTLIMRRDRLTKRLRATHAGPERDALRLAWGRAVRAVWEARYGVVGGREVRV